jgi:hypothetical protein
MISSSKIRSSLRVIAASCIAIAAMLTTAPPLLAGGTWSTLSSVGVPGTAGLCNPLLLTDGTVLVHDCGNKFLTSDWYLLKPDKKGQYVTGTWSATGSLPSGYGPEYFASAVLPDGRVIAEGGEYNISCGKGWTSLGAIYDPLTGSWTAVSPPSGSGWTYTGKCPTTKLNKIGGIGDAPSVVLPNGQFMMGSCCASPAVEALFDATTLAWSATTAPASTCQPAAAAAGWCLKGKAFQEEQGYTLMQNDKVLTISVWDPPKAEAYDQVSGTWSPVAPVPVTLPDTCGGYEIGPALTRHDGTVVAFGGNLCGGTANPTAIYDYASDKWTAGKNLPSKCGTGGTDFCTTADAPAALLPGDNILFAASATDQKPPSHFYEFTSPTAGDKIEKVIDPPSAPTRVAGNYNFLVLPTGEILATNLTHLAEIYTPTGGGISDWKPGITSVPHCLVPGQTYILHGVQLNGRSQGTAYGDDAQGATNYPLVRITHKGSGDVFYARTFDFSTMSIAPGTSSFTKFTVASDTPVGAAELHIVTNGLRSKGQAVTISNTCG